MEDRFPPVDLERATPGAYQAMLALDREARRLGPDKKLLELLKMRASYLNRCAYCIQLHSADARRANEREERLYALAAWHDSPYFDQRERAALTLCDTLTSLDSEQSVGPLVEQARGVFDDTELAAVLWAIVTINAWNRIALAMGLTPPELEDRT